MFASMIAPGYPPWENQATAKLLDLRCTCSRYDEVRKCVEDGAEITYLTGRLAFPTSALHAFITDSTVKYVEICMKYARAVDFRVQDFNKRTPLLLACTVERDEDAKEMLQAMVDRIKEERDGDKVDWSITGIEEFDILSTAAEYRVYSEGCRLLQDAHGSFHAHRGCLLQGLG